LRRLRTLLDAIRADSKEVDAAAEEAIVPWPQQVVVDGADGVIVIVSVMKPVVSESIHVYAANVDGFAKLSELANSSNTDPNAWKRPLAQFAKDLGLAAYTAGTELNVDDSKVRELFRELLPDQVIDRSLLLADQLAPAVGERPAAAQKVAKDIDGTTSAPKLQVYQGKWFADTPSILLLQCHKPG
jgi:hypothetical protein